MVSLLLSSSWMNAPYYIYSAATFPTDMTNLSSWTVAVQAKWETQTEHSTGNIIKYAVNIWRSKAK